MSWYNTKEQYPEQIHIVNTKVRFYRNLAKVNFTVKTDRKTASELTLKVGNILESKGFHAEPTDGKGIIPLLACAARQYIERDFVYSSMPRALYFNEPCSLNISVGGDDFLVIQSILPGFSVKETHKIASSAEEALDGELDFAYHKDLGYLSPDPSHTGSGLIFSAVLFLPALSLCGKATLFSPGLYLQPLYENNCPGYLYELGYIPDVNISEKSAISCFENTLSSIVGAEKEEEKQLFRTPCELYDRAMRACGVMDYSGSVSETELLTLIADLRLYLAMNRDTSLRHNIDGNTLNYLLTEGLNASIAVSLAKIPDSLSAFDTERAKFLNTYLEKMKINA